MNILENIFCFFGLYILVGVDIIIKILAKLYCMAEGEKYYGKIGKIEQGSLSEILGAERELQLAISNSIFTYHCKGKMGNKT